MPSIKELYKKLQDVKIDADSINVNTDGLESLLATTQADIALIKADIANGVLCDVRDGSGNAITSTVIGAKRSLDVTANVSIPSGLDANIRDGDGNLLTSSVRGDERALSVQIVDGSGNQITTFGSGTVSISNSQAELGENAPSQAVQIGGYNLADNKIYPFNVDSDGIQKVEARPLQSSSASITTFTEITSSTILSASSARKGIVFYVSGEGSAFISLGGVATSTSDYSIVVSQNDVANITGYTGDITGLVTGDAVLHVTSLS